MDTTTPLIEQFLQDADRFAEVVRAGGDWSGASPCEGWTAADVVDHVITTERDFLGRHTDIAPAPTGTPAEQWAVHHDELRRVLTPGLVATGFDGYFGPTTVGETLEAFYGFDLLVHRWDLARGLGAEGAFTGAELDRIEAFLPEPGDTMYDTFYADGICAPPVPVADGASREQRVLARCGRRA